MKYMFYYYNQVYHVSLFMYTSSGIVFTFYEANVTNITGLVLEFCIFRYCLDYPSMNPFMYSSLSGCQIRKPYTVGCMRMMYVIYAIYN